MFHKTRTPLVHWFWMIFIMTRQKSGVSMLSLQGMLGIKSYRTVWAMSHKVRKAMADRDSNYQLKGLIETLRSFVGPAKNNSLRNKAKERPSILVQVENLGEGPGFARMTHVSAMPPARAEQEKESPVPESETPKHKRHRQQDNERSESYDDLNPILIGNRKPKRIRWARILAANLTGNIRGVHHGVSEKHLHRYLAEFLYRFNRREWSAQLLDKALSACVSTTTATYAELMT